MIAVITGDVIQSSRRKVDSWLVPLKKLLGEWGDAPISWDVYRGDEFQVEIPQVTDALCRALQLKATLKKQALKGGLDVRMAIGLGEKSHAAERITESNGSAFMHSGQKFDKLKRERLSLAVRSPWEDFDHNMNITLRFAMHIADQWSPQSAEVVLLRLNDRELSQEAMGQLLGIQQSAVSQRWSPAQGDTFMLLLRHFEEQIQNYTP